MREACATCEMGYVRAIYVFLMRLFLVHIDRHSLLAVHPPLSALRSPCFSSTIEREPFSPPLLIAHYGESTSSPKVCVVSSSDDAMPDLLPMPSLFSDPLGISSAVSIIFVCMSVAVLTLFSWGTGQFALRSYIHFRSQRSRSPTGSPEK